MNQLLLLPAILLLPLKFLVLSINFQVSHQLTISVTLNLQVYVLEVEKRDELFKSVVLKVCKLKPICLILIWTVY